MHRSHHRSFVTSASRGRIVALVLGLLVVFGALGFEATHQTGPTASLRPGSSFVDRQEVSVAPAEAAPSESGLSRSHHSPALAFFVILGCALVGAVRRRPATNRHSSRPQLEQFFARRRGPPPALLVR